MSREIRYRAYYKPENRMIYDIQNEFEERIELGMDCFADYLNNDDFVVEQDTGLKDKNGESIWEGDIVQIYKHCSYEKWDKLKVVRWDEKTCRYDGVYPNIAVWSQHEVIGNIHETPELLEEK